MHRISTFGRFLDLFGAGKDGFRDGDRSTSTSPTPFNAAWCNGVQEELSNTIELSGMTLDPEDNTQLYHAIKTMIASSATDYLARYATVANIALAGLGTQAGGDWSVALTAGNVVLVKNQTTASDNGWYIAASGAWVRATFADASAEVKAGVLTQVSEGATLSDTIWMLTTDGAIALGTTALNFEIKASLGLAGFSNLLGYIGTINTKYAVTASVAVVVDQNGLEKRLTSLNLNSLDLTLAQSGAVVNGRDQAATFGPGLIFGYVIWGQGQAEGLLFSGSETSPTLPINYTHKAIVGPMYWDGVKFSLPYRYYGNVCYIDSAPLVLSNGTGTTETQVNTSAFISSLVSHVMYAVNGTITSDTLNRVLVDIELRHISGVTFMHLTPPTYAYATSSSGMPTVTGVQIMMPGAGQKFFYLQSSTLGSSPLLSVGIAAFFYPNGAN